MAKTVDLAIRRGATFTLAARWEGETWLYAAITGITQTAPVQITSAPHSIPDGWRVAVVDAKGMTQLNAANNPPKDKDMRRAAVVSSTVLEFNDTSAAAFSKHTPNTGYIAWLAPRSLAGVIARMQIRERVKGPIVLSLTSAPNGGLSLDDTLKVVEITLTAEQTEIIAQSAGVYDLELVSAGGVVTDLLEGAVTFGPETTTTS